MSGPAPIDVSASVNATPEERVLIDAMVAAYNGLRALGWIEPMYAAPGISLHVIECPSTGIHKAYCDQERRFWVYDGDEWPSRPVLVRAAPENILAHTDSKGTNRG